MKILVLEDWQERVDMLRGMLPDADIVWHTEAVDVAQSLALREYDLIILDHDLGGAPESLAEGTQDRHGHDGMYAIDTMAETNTPVLVWSYNSVRAPQMVDKLLAKNIQAVWYPFGTSRCINYIKRINEG